MENKTKSAFQKREENYQSIMALITNFKAYRSKKGIIYDRNTEKSEIELINWVIKQYQAIDKNKLYNLVSIFRILEEDSLIKTMADLMTIGVITINQDKLPSNIEFVCHPRDFNSVR